MRSGRHRRVSRFPRWTVRVAAACSMLTAVAALAVVPASAEQVRVHPAEWLWNWWYTGPNDFGFAGSLTGLDVSGKGTDFGGIRRLTGTLVDSDPNDGACADLRIFGPDRAQILNVVNCDGDPVSFQTPAVEPRENSNEVVFDLHQVMRDESETGAKFRDRVQNSIIRRFTPTDEAELNIRTPETWVGWHYKDDQTVNFWAFHHRMQIQGRATHEPDGSRTASATVSVLQTPMDGRATILGELHGDQSGSIESRSSRGNPRDITFGRSMLFGNLYYSVYRSLEEKSCVLFICGGSIIEYRGLTGKVTLPGSGM